MMRTSTVRNFRELHRPGEMLFLPNAWDATTALIFEKAGFRAVATTSSGIAASLGYRDGEVMSLDEMLFVVRRMLQCVDIPVSVDVEAGYSNEISEIAEHVVLVAKLGAAGINIEDMGRGATPGLRTVEFACEVIRTARKRLALAGCDLFINARTDTYLSKLFPAAEVMAETIKRGTAYVEAGADCVFVPGASDSGEIRRLCDEIRAPVNILALPGVTNGETLRKLGVARLSIGKSAYNHAIGQIYARAMDFRDQGDAKSFFEQTAPAPTLDMADRRRSDIAR